MIDTRQQLIEIAEIAALLPALLTSRSAPASGAERPAGGLVAHSPAPVRLDVLQALDGRLRDSGDDAEDRAWHDRMAGDHRQGLLPDLWQWARMIEAEAMESSPALPAELPEAPTLTSVVGWLLAHLDWALTQQWSVELVRDVDWWWRRVRRFVGERDPYQPRCGRCLFPVEPSDGGTWRCLGCGQETSLDSALKRLAEPVVTVPQASHVLEVPERTLRRWAKDLLPVDLDGPRYLLKDLRHAADNQPMRGRPAAS